MSQPYGLNWLLHTKIAFQVSGVQADKGARKEKFDRFFVLVYLSKIHYSGMLSDVKIADNRT